MKVTIFWAGFEVTAHQSVPYIHSTSLLSSRVTFNKDTTPRVGKVLNAHIVIIRAVPSTFVIWTRWLVLNIDIHQTTTPCRKSSLNIERSTDNICSGRSPHFAPTTRLHIHNTSVNFSIFQRCVLIRSVTGQYECPSNCHWF